MLLAALLVAAAFALAACGDDTTKGPPAGSPGPPPHARWGAPSGPFAGKRPNGVVMLIHGGGWEGPDRDAFAYEVAIGRVFRNLGYATQTIEYRRGATGIHDAARWYDEARRRVGPHVPICADGTSAGGHVALMLAALRPKLACVIALGSPVDLPALAHQEGGGTAYDLARQAFGESQLAAYSPIRRAQDIRADVLLVAARNDPVVPVAQATEMSRARPATHTILLPGGAENANFVHGKVDKNALVAASQAQIVFLARATQRARSRSRSRDG